MERIKRSLKLFGIAFLLFIPIGLIANEFKSARLQYRSPEFLERVEKRKAEKMAAKHKAEKEADLKEEPSEEPAESENETSKLE